MNNINYTHLINPQSGYTIKHDLISAIVIANDCTTADAFSTALMIKGFDNGLIWINTILNVECLLISKQLNGKYIIAKSNGFHYELNEQTTN
mgnify:CR=1 FL=1